MNTPAGWHPDPERPGWNRYWDGEQWTEHRAEADIKPKKGSRTPLYILLAVALFCGLPLVIETIRFQATTPVVASHPVATAPTTPATATALPATAPPKTAPPTTSTPTTADPYARESVGQRNAREKAASYLQFAPFSRSELISQLAYEHFSNADATYGVDAQKADWNDQAAKKGKAYMSHSSFSRQGLIDQLVYDGFTKPQAEFGAKANGY